MKKPSTHTTAEFPALSTVSIPDRGGFDVLLPPEIRTYDCLSDDLGAKLFPIEQEAIADSASARQDEFRTGRHCARKALGQLGMPPTAIPVGPHREPLWPPGIVGSITHCDGYRAAAVARSSQVLSLGIDAEAHIPLPSGVLEEIALPEERNDIAELCSAAPAVQWDRVLFSAKESIYKTWFPVAHRWLDFSECRIRIDAEAGLYSAEIPASSVPPHLQRIHGRWHIDAGHIKTAAWLMVTCHKAIGLTDQTRPHGSTEAATHQTPSSSGGPAPGAPPLHPASSSRSDPSDTTETKVRHIRASVRSLQDQCAWSRRPPHIAGDNSATGCRLGRGCATSRHLAVRRSHPLHYQYRNVSVDVSGTTGTERIPVRRPEFDRDQALDAAMRVFWEKGYNDTSIQDLSDATGLQRSSLYNTFTGKRELYMAALRRYHARRAEQCAALETSLDPIEALQGFVESVVRDELTDTRGLGCMVANASLEFGGNDREVTALTSYNLSMVAESMESTIRRGQAQGRIGDAVDPKMAARSIVVTIQGLRVVGKGVAVDEREAWLQAASSACLASLAA